jgi:hypothetical protein
MAAIRQGNVSAEGVKALTFLKKVFARFFQKALAYFLLTSLLRPITRDVRERFAGGFCL